MHGSCFNLDGLSFNFIGLFALFLLLIIVFFISRALKTNYWKTFIIVLLILFALAVFNYFI